MREKLRDRQKGYSPMCQEIILYNYVKEHIFHLQQLEYHKRYSNFAAETSEPL